MNTYLGIDLGSTTSKAVLLDDRRTIIGRGITNTRANYEVAAEIARGEAEFNSRFTLLHRGLTADDGDAAQEELLTILEKAFRYLQFKQRLLLLWEDMKSRNDEKNREGLRDKVRACLDRLSPLLLSGVRQRFLEGTVSRSSEFFREIFSSLYLQILQDEEPELFDPLLALYEQCITPVENRLIKFDFVNLIHEALTCLPGERQELQRSLGRPLEEASRIDLTPRDFIGTGYGRQLLPFDNKHIRSEILCHAFGAHAVFPRTRTVLDIGGQDTKAIQVNAEGIVTSFQMNDRCAAGCGRYLGYIADEMNVSVSELGPMALACAYETNICSTCTVFAGAELREHLNLGEAKENILAGLHKAIVQRAFALLARSGGVRDEFTFTGGVARNPAVVKYVRHMVGDYYGPLTINIHPDSIFMGALGAALFSARRS